MSKMTNSPTMAGKYDEIKKCSTLNISHKESFKSWCTFIEDIGARSHQSQDSSNRSRRCTNPSLTSTSPAFKQYMMLPPEIKDMISREIFYDSVLPAYNYLLAIEPLKGHHAYARSLLEDVDVSDQNFEAFKEKFKNGKYMSIRSLNFVGHHSAFQGHPMAISNNLSCILLDLQKDEDFRYCKGLQKESFYRKAHDNVLGAIGWLWAASRIGIFELRIKLPAGALSNDGEEEKRRISLMDCLNKNMGVSAVIEERDDNIGDGYALLWKKGWEKCSQ